MRSQILDLHKALQTGEISAVALAEEKLRALKKNTHNTVSFLPAEMVLELAAQADKKIRQGQKIALLEGIPFGMKDVYLLQGVPASAGSAFLKNYLAPYTATAIKKLLNLGALPLVKENCDSFGHGSTSENTVFGPVKNARNPALVAGGSSGGSAVNVAKGFTTFSVGGDTGGSIRQPAGFNQVYGFKPSYGRISRFGLMAYASSTDCVGPIATSVEDIKIVLNAMSGKDTRDQTTFPSEPVGDLSANFNHKDLTVGYYTQFLENEGLNGDIKQSFIDFLEELSAEGIKIKPLDFKDAETLVAAYYVLAMAETASNLARLDGSTYGHRRAHQLLSESYALSRSEYFTGETKRRIVGGNQVLSQGYAEEIYLKAKKLRSKIATHFANDFREVALLLSPVSPVYPPKIGESLQDPLAMYLSDIYTIGFSLGGLPTLSAPLGTPTGLQITAQKHQDALVLKFAKYLEHRNSPFGG